MHTPDFNSLGLMDESLRALEQEGYTRPTPIQLEAIPVVLEGRDVLACAQTGTGKTAAFALPVIQLLTESASHGRSRRRVRALVVAPTRELAAQIDQGFAAYGRHAGLERACIFGGVGKAPQVRALARGVDVLTATPGRLLDLAGEGTVDLSAVEIAVFDEADRMLDMGFIRDVRKIVALLPKDRQTLLFSATMPEEIEDLARSMLRNPVRIDVDPETPAVERIRQQLYYVEKADKRELLATLMHQMEVRRAIVFSRTKHGADRIAKGLEAAGIRAGVIHANKGQGNRTRTMEAFRSGETRVLVATDIAARGIDVDDITHVFNFDMPTEPETYVHRIGRTARAGADGTSVSFCDTEEVKLLKQVEKLLKKTIPVSADLRPAVSSAAPNPSAAPDGPPRRNEGRNPGQGRRAEGRDDRSRGRASAPAAGQAATRQARTDGRSASGSGRGAAARAGGGADRGAGRNAERPSGQASRPRPGQERPPRPRDKAAPDGRGTGFERGGGGPARPRADRSGGASTGPTPDRNAPKPAEKPSWAFWKRGPRSDER